MTTTQFAPSVSTPFQFQAQLDGALYTCIITWNVAAQRWYLNVLDSSNVRIVTIAMVGSPPPSVGNPINLVAGYFDSSLVFYQLTQTFVVLP